MPPQTQSAVEKEAERKRKEAAHRKEAMQAGSKAVTKAANKAIKGEDLTTEESVKELVGGLIVTQLPPDAKKAVEAAMKVDYDKVFPKDKNGDRDLSTEGLIRQGLVLLDELGGPEVKKALETRKNALEIAEKFGIDVPTIEEILNTDWDKLFDKLDKGISDISASEAIRGVMSILEKYGGEQIQKALEARKKFLELADKIGLKIPTIEDLIDFDWSTLADKLGSLEFSDIFDIDKLIDYLEGELLSFLPPGSADSLKHIRTMLKEFELPTSLKEVYHSLDDKKKELEAQKPAVPSMPGVFVNGHTIARVGRTFMAHGGVPLTGPAAKTVKADFMPVWCANPSHVHACPAPFLVPPAPDGPAFASKGSTDVMVEFFPVCRHDLDALDIKCTPTNRFLTEALAKAAWKELEKINKPTPEESEKDKKNSNANNGNEGNDDSGGKEGKKENGEKEKDEPGKQKPVAVINSDGLPSSIELGKPATLTSASYDPDVGTAGQNEGIARYEWTLTNQCGSKSAATQAFDLRSILSTGVNSVSLTVWDEDGESSNVANHSISVTLPRVTARIRAFIPSNLSVVETWVLKDGQSVRVIPGPPPINFQDLVDDLVKSQYLTPDFLGKEAFIELVQYFADLFDQETREQITHEIAEIIDSGAGFIGSFLDWVAEHSIGINTISKWLGESIEGVLAGVIKFFPYFAYHTDEPNGTSGRLISAIDIDENGLSTSPGSSSCSETIAYAKVYFEAPIKLMHVVEMLVQRVIGGPDKAFIHGRATGVVVGGWTESESFQPCQTPATIKIEADLSTTMPLCSVSPEVNAVLTLSVDYSARTIKINGVIDDFPAYDISVSVGGLEIINKRINPAPGNTPANLVGSATNPVNITASF